jgi:glutamine synthetase
LSYERVKPYLAGNVVAWGTENRLVPIRKIKCGHWEMRCVDATVNICLALAAILSASLVGCAKEELLVWPDTALSADLCPSSGVPLPHSIEGVLDWFEGRFKDIETMMASRVIHH